MSLLAGVRVIELGLWVAAPAAGAILADWGAEVIKVEPLEGEPMRHVLRLTAGHGASRTPLFDLDNRGKRSLAVDLGRPAGRQLLDRLLDGADVFLTNLRPAALERLGLEPDRVLARHERVVYASVSGYGLTGPDRDLPGYDIGAFWARSGAADVIVPPGAEPPASSVAFGDHVTALTAVAGIMAALYHRQHTGRGQLVEASLLRTGMYTVSSDLAVELFHGRRAPTPPRQKVANPLLNRYRAGDGRWFFLVGIESDRHWPALCNALDLPGLAGDERFADARARRHHAEEMVAFLDAEFARRDRAEWAERFERCGVWWAPVATTAEAVADPQADAVGAFVDVPDGDGSSYRSVATPLGFGAAAVGPQGPVPPLGHDTDRVLRHLGLGDAELEALREEGVIFDAAAG